MFRLRKQPAIAVLDIAGAIDEAQALQTLLTIRNTDWRKKNVRGLIIRICSNGGSLGAAQAICEGIDTLRDELGLVTVALATETALSAAFYVAIACDIVIATPAATVGNIGAIVSKVSGFPLADKLGIAFQPVRTGLGKGALHPLAAPDSRSEELLGLLVTDIGEQFFTWVKNRCNVPDSTIDLIRDGRMLSGKQALQLGLITQCGGLYAALTVACERNDLESAALLWLNPARQGMVARLLRGIRAFF